MHQAPCAAVCNLLGECSKNMMWQGLSCVMYEYFVHATASGASHIVMMYGAKRCVLFRQDAYVSVLYGVVYAERAPRERAPVRGRMKVT